MIGKKEKTEILHNTKIADVISDYLRLVPRGDNFVGFCPFHNSGMMTFNIDSSNNTYFCSECGKHGSTIDFLIDTLHINYDEALVIMAQKSHNAISVEVKQSKAETLFSINAEASRYYRQQLFETETGRNIALSYYKQKRGFSEEIIEKFQLGYSPARQENHLIDNLTGQGFSEEDIVASGIGVRFDDHPTYDRFHERITFPIFNLSGKIVAFSCRTMKSDTNIAKYKNTNDTPIYTKGNEIYGLYQARKQILANNHCILVEGNADVVSMHEAGFTVTVAPLGTGFTFNQACVLRRFTNNITLLFDGDNAGLHANEVALQHFLPLGIIPHIVLLPYGEDPDSFSRSKSYEDAQQYLIEHDIDLVDFYFTTKLGGQLSDPIRTAQVVREIIQKIALIPNAITRNSYIKKCSYLLKINEESVLRDVQQEVQRNKNEVFSRQQQALARAQHMASIAMSNSDATPTQTPEVSTTEISTEDNSQIQEMQMVESSLLTASLQSDVANEVSIQILNKERVIMHYIAKYGMLQFSTKLSDNGTAVPINLIEYIDQEFFIHELCIHDTLLKRIYDIALNIVTDFYSDFSDYKEFEELNKKEKFDAGINEIREKSLDMDSIHREEKELSKRINAESEIEMTKYQCHYLEDYLCSHPEREIRDEAFNLVNEPFKLSKIHTQQATVASEYSNLDSLVQTAINDLRYEMMTEKINTLRKLLETETDKNTILQLMTQMMELQKNRQQLAEDFLGVRVINP